MPAVQAAQGQVQSGVRQVSAMSKHIIAVNAGPRKGWNTDTLITQASQGAEAAGAEVERFDLFRLEKYTGCVSCFGCEKEKMGYVPFVSQKPGDAAFTRVTEGFSFPYGFKHGKVIEITGEEYERLKSYSS